jgi:Zn-dependent protease
MFSLISSIGPEIPLSLLLMSLLGLRAKVWPRASLFMKTTPEKLFALLDIVDGKREDWGRTTTLTEMVDKDRLIFRKTYTTTLTSGESRATSALFSVRRRQQSEIIEIQREGLEGKTLNNELISQTYTITPEPGGARLAMQYEWGPRPFIAQILARADLWGGIFRLRGLAERGVPNDRPYQLISALVAIVTGALSLAAFAMLLGWLPAGILIAVLFVHEFGHLLAYRMMGQPWGRMVFLPFLGAMALPRLRFDSQGQAVFAALMGPGFSVLLALLCTVYAAVFLEGSNEFIVWLGLISTALNIFNLLPVEPLDGGVALRSVLGKLMGTQARFGLMAVGVVIAIVGLALSQIILVLFGGIAIFLNLKSRIIDGGLASLSRFQVTVSFFCYCSLVATYVTLLVFYVRLFNLPAAS